MERYWAMIENGVVENISVWDGVTPWVPPSNYEIVEITNYINGPQIGWTYQNGQFYPPVEPDPVPATPTDGPAVL